MIDISFVSFRFKLLKNTTINFKCSDKGSTTAILKKRDKIQGAQVQESKQKCLIKAESSWQYGNVT